jgi:hypothetical protein
MEYDQRIIVRFLHNESMQPDQIHIKLKTQFKNDSYGLRSV